MSTITIRKPLLKKLIIKVFRLFRRYNPNVMEVYIILRSMIEDVEKHAKKDGIDLSELYLEIKNETLKHKTPGES